MVDPRYIHAKQILDWFKQKCEEACTEESLAAIEYINLQLAIHKAASVVDTLYSYPITLTQEGDNVSI